MKVLYLDLGLEVHILKKTGIYACQYLTLVPLELFDSDKRNKNTSHIQYMKEYFKMHKFYNH